MAVSRGFYRRWYGLEAELTSVPEYVRDMDTYFSTDSKKLYIRYDDNWYLVGTTTLVT